MTYHQIAPGNQLPDATLALLEGNKPKPVRLHDLLRHRNILIAGLPGAFTPTCTRHHLPNLIANAGRLHAAGLDEIYCIVPNDPWVLREWAQKLHASGLTFLSDGNLDFIMRCGLTHPAQDRFMGLRSQRYVITARNLIVQRMIIEPDAYALTCTHADAILSS